MFVKIASLLIGLILTGYLVFASFFFHEMRQGDICENLIVVVKDSLDKHFVTPDDLTGLLKKADLDPIGKPLETINTDKIEKELLKNEMIARIEAYKTPSRSIKLEVVQKMPVLRIMGSKGNYYIDNEGSTMPVSRRYVANVPIVTGHVEKEMAQTGLYKFALFLQKNEFWNNQIEQIHVHPDGDIDLISRVGDHRIVLGDLEDFAEKLENLQLFYEQAIPKVGWQMYRIINLKYKDQIVCTKK